MNMACHMPSDIMLERLHEKLILGAVEAIGGEMWNDTNFGRNCSYFLLRFRDINVLLQERNDVITDFVTRYAVGVNVKVDSESATLTLY